MKVGILHAVPAALDIGAVSDAEKFQRFLAKADASIETTLYQATLCALPTNLNECDAYLIGVCFGHQLIAQALGGKVDRQRMANR